MSTRHEFARSEPHLQPSAVVEPKETLRKSYSMPLSIRETSDIPIGSLTIKSSESLPYPSIVRPSKSEEVLSHQLDRYGFIVNMDSHGNVVHDTMMTTDANHSIQHLPPDHPSASLPMEPSDPSPRGVGRTSSSTDAARTARRVSKWESMLRWPLDLSEHSSDSSSSSTWTVFWRRSQRQRRYQMVKRRLRKGIPNQQQRAQVWPILCHVEERIRENPGLYRLLVETSVGGALPGTTTTAVSPSTIRSTTTTTTDPSPPLINGSSTHLPAATSDTSTNTKIEINYTKKIGPSQLLSSLKPHQRCNNKHVIAFQYTKSFKNVQDTIERDLHRTFPRHSLFYTDCAEEDSMENGHSSSGRQDSVMNDDEQSSDTREWQQKGICGTTEISSLMRELDLVPSPLATPAMPEDVTLEKVPEVGTAPSAELVEDNEDAMGLAKMLDGAGGQSRLRRVLNAYGTYDREIGYCQGMNFIAAMFLTLVSEEVAFWMLVSVMQDSPCRMRGMFGEGMRETHQSLYVAEKLIQQFLPKLFKHFEKETIHVTMFATQWVLTQYTSSFRFDLVTRLWDCFLFEGWKVTYRVMLALLQHSQTRLQSMGFEEILAFFRELPDRPEIDGSIVDLAMKIPLRISHIRKYEKEWLLEQTRIQSNASG